MKKMWFQQPTPNEAGQFFAERIQIQASMKTNDEMQINIASLCCEIGAVLDTNDKDDIFRFDIFTIKMIAKFQSSKNKIYEIFLHELYFYLVIFAFAFACDMNQYGCWIKKPKKEYPHYELF